MSGSDIHSLILWRYSAPRLERLRTLLDHSPSIRLVYQARRCLPADGVRKIIRGMYESYVARPLERQIASLADAEYYFSVVVDSQPDYAWLKTRAGLVHGNRNLYALKERYRATDDEAAWLSLHASLNPVESARDIFVNTGRPAAHFLGEGCIGAADREPAYLPGSFDSTERFLLALGAYRNCTPMLDTADRLYGGRRDFDAGEPIYILADDPVELSNYLGAEGGRVAIAGRPFEVKIAGMHGGPFCPVWVKEMLDRRVMLGDIPVPASIDHLFSTLYAVTVFSGGLDATLLKRANDFNAAHRVIEGGGFRKGEAQAMEMLARFLRNCNYTVPANVLEYARDRPALQVLLAGCRRCEAGLGE